MTENAKGALATEAQNVNPVLESLDPAVFEVSAKKQAAIWSSDQYKDQSFRQDLTNSVNRIEQCKLPEQDMLERMRVTEFNNRITNVSEYANALNRGRVFINPKFSSC